MGSYDGRDQNAPRSEPPPGVGSRSVARPQPPGIDTPTAVVEEVEESVHEFLAMLAHELRNPLAPIRNALHVVQMRGRTAAGRPAGVGADRAAGGEPCPPRWTTFST